MTILAESVDTVRLESDQQIVSTTLVDIVGLAFTLRSGARYLINFALAWKPIQPSPTPTGQPQFGATFPAVSLFGMGFRHHAGTFQFTSVETKGQIITSGVGVSTSSVSTDPTAPYFIGMRGIIQPSADGILQLQMALSGNIGPTSNPYWVYAGSCGIMRRLS